MSDPTTLSDILAARGVHCPDERAELLRSVTVEELETADAADLAGILLATPAPSLLAAEWGDDGAERAALEVAS